MQSFAGKSKAGGVAKPNEIDNFAANRFGGVFAACRRRL